MGGFEMWLGINLIVISLLALVLLAIAINRRHLDRAYARLVAELLNEREPSAGFFHTAELEDLPAPVRRYLNKAIPEGRPYVKAVHLRQVGEFRPGDTTAPWKPLEAEQHFTVNPPGFVWDAKIDMAPLIQVRVIDMYKGGKGILRAKMFSTLTVADAQGHPKLDAGELMRYLAEAVWFPTALLPGQGIEWSPIDDHSAKATLEHEGTSASIVFYFNDRDEVERIHAEGRFREVEGDYEPTPWTGYWGNYQTRNGLLIPIEGRVEWNLPEGALTYWRAHLEEIDHLLD
jgi:hypothetical protein